MRAGNEKRKAFRIYQIKSLINQTIIPLTFCNNVSHFKGMLEYMFACLFSALGGNVLGFHIA
jgi:hypothetical protein